LLGDPRVRVEDVSAKRLRGAYLVSIRARLP